VLIIPSGFLLAGDTGIYRGNKGEKQTTKMTIKINKFNKLYYIFSPTTTPN
jgi:hypothetical protein